MTLLGKGEGEGEGEGPFSLPWPRLPVRDRRTSLGTKSSRGLKAASKVLSLDRDALSAICPTMIWPVVTSSAHAPITTPPLPSASASASARLPASTTSASAGSFASPLPPFPPLPPLPPFSPFFPFSPSLPACSSTSAKTYAGSLAFLTISASNKAPCDSTATFSRLTTTSIFKPLRLRTALRSLSCSGVSVCSTTTTRKPLRASFSALLA